jgi:L-ascorbate metabolism protein UlaG (beta-lactamase superfamily)
MKLRKEKKRRRKRMKIKFFGHSCFLIEEKLRILIDPFISENPKATAEVKDIKADIILVSHDHGDHLGDTVAIAKSSDAVVVCVFELAQELGRKGVSVIGGNIGGTIEHKGVKISFVRADHSCSKGTPVGFVIHLSSNVYFAGDTGVTQDMITTRELYHPDIAILPIDGVFNMGPEEAVYAINLLQPKIVIPMHYGTFPLLRGTPAQLKELMLKEKIKAEMIEFKIDEEKEISLQP